MLPFVVYLSTLLVPLAAAAEEVTEQGQAATDLLADETPANGKPDRVDTAIEAIFSDVARAWREGEAQAIVTHLGKRGVHLSFAPGGPPEGQFTRNQAYYLLAELFRTTETVRFEFLRFRHLDGKEGRPNGTAERVRRLDDSTLRRDLVFVSLAREEKRWTIAEIKSKDN